MERGDDCRVKFRDGVGGDGSKVKLRENVLMILKLR